MNSRKDQDGRIVAAKTDPEIKRRHIEHVLKTNFVQTEILKRIGQLPKMQFSRVNRFK